MNLVIRHGENLLLPIDRKLNTTKSTKTYIVGHSETGHHHVLESKTDFDVEVDRDELYLRLFEPAKLVHKKSFDKHRTLNIPAGTYKVVRKTEYDPWQQIMRAVWD